MVATLYFVNVGGHVLTIRGDGRGQFQWTDGVENACLDGHVRRGARITLHRAFDNGRERRMFAFAFDGDYDSPILAFMLYLCTRSIHLTNQQLRNLLANHIEEHLDSRHNTYDPNSLSRNTTHRQALDWFCKETKPVIGNRRELRRPGVRLPHTFIQAFCDVFGFPCELWVHASFPKTPREAGSIEKSSTYLSNRIQGFPHQDIAGPVRFFVRASSKTNRTVELLGTVESSFEVDDEQLR
jgi:hypothetical protein